MSDVSSRHGLRSGRHKTQLSFPFTFLTSIEGSKFPSSHLRCTTPSDTKTPSGVRRQKRDIGTRRPMSVSFNRLATSSSASFGMHSQGGTPRPREICVSPAMSSAVKVLSQTVSRMELPKRNVCRGPVFSIAAPLQTSSCFFVPSTSLTHFGTLYEVNAKLICVKRINALLPSSSGRSNCVCARKVLLPEATKGRSVPGSRGSKSSFPFLSVFEKNFVSAGICRNGRSP